MTASENHFWQKTKSYFSTADDSVLFRSQKSIFPENLTFEVSDLNASA